MQRIPSYREIMNIAFPLMIGSISESISSVVDTAFMGQLGTLEIGGMGITNVFMLMFLMLGWSISRSVQIIVSQNYGAQNYRNIGETVFNGFVILLPVGFIILYILYFQSEFLLQFIIDNPSLKKISFEICQMRSFGFPVLMMTLLISSFYTGLGKTKILMYSQGAAALSNIILNYVLVFGKMGLPAMGYKGSALATVLSEVICLAILVVSILINKKLIKEYYLFYNNKVRTYLCKEIGDLASPMLVLHLFSLGSWVYFFALIEKMGEKELAISMVLKQIFISITIPGFALAGTANTLVGQLVGSRNIDGIVPTIFKVVKINYLILTSMAVVTFIFRVPIVSLFTEDPFVIENINFPLMALLSAYLFIPFSNTMFNSISALGNTKISLALESTVVVIYLIYLYVALTVYQGGLNAAWFSETIYWFFLLFFGLIYFYRFDWKKNIVFLDQNSKSDE